MKIAVITCDRYAWLCPLFLKYWQRAWPDCPYRLEVVGGTLPTPGADNVLLGEDRGWATNMLSYLGESDEPILLMLDDYMTDSIDADLVGWAEKLINFPRVGLVRLYPCPGPTRTLWPTLPELPADAFGVIDKHEPYGVSLQAAIWRPQVLREVLRSGETPWETEIDGSVRVREYQQYEFLATFSSAIGYREYMKRGQPIVSTVDWVEAHP